MVQVNDIRRQSELNCLSVQKVNFVGPVKVCSLHQGFVTYPQNTLVIYQKSLYLVEEYLHKQKRMNHLFGFFFFFLVRWVSILKIKKDSFSCHFEFCVAMQLSNTRSRTRCSYVLEVSQQSPPPKSLFRSRSFALSIWVFAVEIGGERLRCTRRGCNAISFQCLIKGTSGAEPSYFAESCSPVFGICTSYLHSYEGLPVSEIFLKVIASAYFAGVTLSSNYFDAKS